MKFAAFAILFFFTLSMSAQEKAPKNWFTGDPDTKGTIGVGAEKAYKELLKGKKSSTVLVAVLDSGMDIDHEDLKSNIWTNPGEIAGDGIDNDKNGYVDDVHGWNFLGGKDGKNVTDENIELTRLYRDMKPKFKDMDESKVKGKKAKKEFAAWTNIKKQFEAKLEEAQAGQQQMVMVKKMFSEACEKLKSKLGITELKSNELDTYKQKLQGNDEMLKNLSIVGGILSRGGGTDKDIMSQIEKGEKYYGDQVNFNLNVDFDPRKIVGDNYANSAERNYGNNDVRGDLKTEEHATHVAGIIGAVRNNNIGMDGVCENVKIMAVRCVPNGDERDKDVANAIRYAVDNGAKIINMSFGKGFKYDKKAVDEAVKYAEKKNVLLVHAAGNDGLDLQKSDSYPNPKYDDNPRKRAKNVLTVGASSWKSGDALPANFSNYSSKDVDLFAPGVDIYSTVPVSKYDTFDGTSMASPCAAGCAALLLSYYPQLTAVQLREILMKTATRVKADVSQPGSGKKVPFADLSVTGGVINVYAALQEAEKMTKK